MLHTDHLCFLLSQTAGRYLGGKLILFLFCVMCRSKVWGL